MGRGRKQTGRKMKARKSQRKLKARQKKLGDTTRATRKSKNS